MSNEHFRRLVKKLTDAAFNEGAYFGALGFNGQLVRRYRQIEASKLLAAIDELLRNQND